MISLENQWGTKKGKRKNDSKRSHGILVAQESDKMIEEDKIIKEAKKATEENGIVFLDEIDKVSARSDRLRRCFKRRCSKRFVTFN